MSNVRGPASSSQALESTKESEKQRLDREEKERLRKLNLEKESVKEQILEVCDGLKLADSNDIADTTAIPSLCQLLKQLLVLSDLKLGTDITESPEDLSCLLKLSKKHRYGYCNITICCEILNHLLKVSGSHYSTQSRAEILEELSELYLTKASFDNAVTTAEELAKLASKLGDKKLEAKAYHMCIEPLAEKGLWQSAKNTLEKCVQCSKESGDELSRGYSYLSKATLLFYEENYEKALEEGETFLEIAKRLNNKTAQCEAVLKLARINFNLFNTQTAFDLFSEGLKRAIKLEDQRKVMSSKFYLTSIYTIMSKYRKAYNIRKQIVKTLNRYEDGRLVFSVLCGQSVDALMLNKDQESLKLAQKSLVVAKELGAVESISLAHGNIGLAQEKLQDYEGAMESYEKCLEFGEKIKDRRIINNSYCNIGRAFEGKGDKIMAKEYYLKALNMPGQTPSSHWCDTEDFRFSPDYLLAKLAVEEEDYPTAKKYFQQVVDRCEKLRKSVHDSSLKIRFNETQKKPFQYLQHMLLQEKADEAALLVSEMGRGRDFYDKVIKENQSKKLKTSEALLDVAKTNNLAVLFLSKLDVIQEMRTWFITPDGEITSFGYPLNQWEELLKDLRVVFSEVLTDQIQIPQAVTQMAQPGSEGTTDIFNVTELAQPYSENSKNPATQPTIEFRGVDIRIAGDDESDDESEDESEDDYDELGEDVNNGDQPGVKSVNDVDNDKATVQETNGNDAYSTSNLTATRGPPVQSNIPPVAPANIPDFPTLIEKFSELIVRPIESQLANLVSDSGSKPGLLIIPQGQTFNIPYAILHLQNQEPLCSIVSPCEAFSFHSYCYSTTLQEETKTQLLQMNDALIVGNPTNNLQFAQKEAEMIAKKLGVTPLLKYSATRSEVLSRLLQAPIIHFACHGTIDGRSLLLAPEEVSNNAEVAKVSYITVEDISNKSIQANMVVLSACHTARGKISSEGVLGLARAFLMAGAKSVVTALWALNDNATEKFMSKFYDNLASEPVVDALATTMCEMREKFKVTQWGSFKVLGANVKVFSN